MSDEKKKEEGRPTPPPRLGSSGLQIDRRHLALLATLEVEADLLALLQVTEAGALDRRDVNEDVLRAILGLNEAEALRGVEPFDCTDGHLSLQRSEEHTSELQSHSF